MAGIFTLVLLAAAALVAVWIGRDRTKLQTYEIVSATAVTVSYTHLTLPTSDLV